jgi:hypothetical protein
MRMNKNLFELRKEIALTLENHLNNTCSVSESPASRYAKGVILLTRSTNKSSQDTAFIQNFIRILHEPKIPFLRVETVQKLHARSIHHPHLLDELLFIARHSKGVEIPEMIWMRMIQRSGLDRSNKTLQAKRLTLLVWLVKNFPSDSQDWVNKTALIDRVLSFNFPSYQDQSLSDFRTDLQGKRESLIGFVLLRLRKMWKDGLSGFELAEFLESYFKIIYVQDFTHPEFHALLHELDQVLPNNYLLQLHPQDLISIWEIYKIRPALVSDLPAQQSDVVTKKSIIQGLFSKFTLPGNSCQSLHFRQPFWNRGQLVLFCIGRS